MKEVKWLRIVLLGSLLIAGGVGRAHSQGTQPLVAIHDSELTRAMETEIASNGTPTGQGTTGHQWWPTDWHYFVMPDSLKQAFQSDGTAYTVLGDSNITAGALLTNGVPKYPIFISLSSEAMRDDEIAPLTNYVAAGGFLFVGGSSFTRNTNGTSRGDFALANAMGVHMVVNGLTNWGLANYLTTQTNNRIVNDIPSGANTWQMPAYSEEIVWGTSPTHNYLAPHDVWQVQAGGATVLAQGDNYPYILIKQYGKGYFIYDAAFEPLMGHGGFAPGMYAYMIFRRSIEWAFESANLPILKLSPWPYQYNAAFMVRHDLENYDNEIADLMASAQVESSNGAKGDYYFCTGTLRQDMYSLYNTNTVISSLRQAVTNYGASIGPHNGGLPNPYNPALYETNGIGSTYDYWHWGPDEVLDTSPPGYANGTAYAYTSLSNAFGDVESWLSGIESKSMRLWVACYFNGTRESSLSNQAALGVKIAGDQKLTPFPAWTMSTQTPDLLYPTLTEPVSDWYVGGLVAQSLEPWHPPGVHTSATVMAAVDYYYNLGFMINIYSHTLATGEGDAGALMPEYLTYCANTNIHPRIWSQNAIGIYNWWVARANAQISVSYATNGNQSTASISVAHATDPGTGVELYIPATTSFCSLQVFTNGFLASTNSYRIVGQVVKVLVGTTVSNVLVSYYPVGSPVNVFSQNFDSVTAPALPSGWSTSANGVESNWVTEKSVVDTAPNGAFVPDVGNIGLSYLTSPSIAIPGGQTQLSFMNNYNLETGPGSDGFDGGVLEIKIGTGSFTDIIAAGGSFITGGYNSLIDTNYQSPIAGRAAWSGSSGGFIPTVVNLPPAAAGQNVQLRWGCGTDNGNAFTGWYIDTISMTNRVCGCCNTNTPPTLPGQSSITVPELTPLVVTNTATDTNVPANELTYSLVSPPGGAGVSNGGIITWTPSQNESPGNYTITTVVSDNGAPPLTATNSFTVTVTEVNVAPTLSNIGARTVNELATLTVTNAATETNIHSVTIGYGLVNPPNGATISGSGVITWMPGQIQSHSTNVFMTVATNSNPYDTVNPTLTATNSFNVVVKEVNVVPSLSNIGMQTVNELTTLMVTNAATESNIDSVTTGYGLINPPGGASINSSGVITWMPGQSQSHSTNLIKTVVTNSNPYDTVHPTLTATNSFTVVVKEVNVPPSLSNIGMQTVNELTTLTVINAATEVNTNSLTTGYGLINPPSGASINGSGVITWMPGQSQSHSTNVITTIVTNNNPFDTIHPILTATNSFTVVVKEVNVAPSLSNIGMQTVNELTTLTVTNAATEVNTNSVITGYGLLNPPNGASISGSGVITWMPGQSQSHSTNVIMTVVTNSNPYDTVNPTLTATNSFTVVVKEVNVSPSLGNISLQTVSELTTLTVTNAAAEANTNSVTTGYGLLNSPSGASINGSGVITWMPGQSQSHSTNVITTVVTNSNPYDTVNPILTATNSFTVVVKEVNVAPSLSNIGMQTVNELTTLTVTNAAAEANTNSVTTGYGLLNPPSGASISGSGVITWMPGQSQSHSTNLITTVVTNNNPYDAVNPTLTATNSFTVVVKEVNIAPVLPPQNDTNVNELATLMVTNTAAEPNSDSVSTGYGLINPPAGANIDTNGIITWTPDQNQSPGTNVITTVVTNNNPYDTVNPMLTATNSFTVVVNEVNTAPILPAQNSTNINELATLVVTNTAGEPNIHSVTTGYVLLNPPTGATIDSNGIITWTPAQNQSPGTYALATVVNNSNPYDLVNPQLATSNSFTVIVNEVNVAPVLPAQSDVSGDENTTLVLTNAATEPNIHSATIGYGLINPPAGASIDTNGVITWTPTVAEESASNVLITVVTNANPYDTVNPQLTATNSFNGFVTDPVVSPLILSVKLTNGMATVTWTTVPGHAYTLEYQDTLGTDWTNVLPAVSASGSQASMTNAAGGAPRRLYQVITAPTQFHPTH
jgi:hypothetical protein